MAASAAAVTIAAGAAYGVGQTVLRTGANDPQIQVAQDAAANLSAGAGAATVGTGAAVDLATSFAVEVTVPDGAGNILASTGRLDGEPVRPPLGALRAAARHGSHLVTWQPRAGVRMATVIEAYTGPTGGGTVVVARSLRTVEQRESRLLGLVAAGWVGGLAVTAVAAVAGAVLLPRSLPPGGPREPSR